MTPSNRTTLECKFDLNLLQSNLAPTSNRTTLECKFQLLFMRKSMVWPFK